LGRSALDAKDPRKAADEHGTLEAKGHEVLRRRLVDDLGGFELDRTRTSFVDATKRILAFILAFYKYWLLILYNTQGRISPCREYLSL